MADNYTKEMAEAIERTVMKGSADKHVLQTIASVLWQMDQRLDALENTKKTPTKKAPIGSKKSTPEVTEE